MKHLKKHLKRGILALAVVSPLLMAATVSTVNSGVSSTTAVQAGMNQPVPVQTTNNGASTTVGSTGTSNPVALPTNAGNNSFNSMNPLLLQTNPQPNFSPAQNPPFQPAQPLPVNPSNPTAQ